MLLQKIFKNFTSERKTRKTLLLVFECVENHKKIEIEYSPNFHYKQYTTLILLNVIAEIETQECRVEYECKCSGMNLITYIKKQNVMQKKQSPQHYDKLCTDLTLTDRSTDADSCKKLIKKCFIWYENQFSKQTCLLKKLKYSRRALVFQVLIASFRFYG
jgi:hypothetical protein